MAGQNEQNVVETSVQASVEVAPAAEPVQVETAPVSEPVAEAPKKARKPRAKKVLVIPAAEKAAPEKVEAAEDAQDTRRKVLAAEANAAKLEKQANKRDGRGRPAFSETITAVALSHIILLLTRFGATGARRRLAAVGGADSTGAEKAWRKDSTGAWAEVNGEGSAPNYPRISLPTLLDIAEKAKLVLKKGRPAAKVA
jgi:hypothetical protein